MYRPHDSDPIGRAPAVALATRRPAPAPAASARAVGPCHPLHPQHWVTDLAEDIGSRRWYRGLFTLLALLVFALAFWPDLSAVQAAPATRIDRRTGQDLRAYAMALGDDPGPARLTGTAAMRLVPFVPERPRIAMTAELPAEPPGGDSLQRLLQRAGVAGDDAARANALVAGAVPLDQLAPGTRVVLVLGPRPAPGLARPLERAELRARLDLALAVTRAGGTLALERRPIAVD
ncbi:MAG TPA: M23 family peptidase, partial [Novosphingobium sp.]